MSVTMSRCRWWAPISWPHRAATSRRSWPRRSSSATGPIPYTIVHATQFFEFLKTLADSATVDDTVRMPPAYFQPMAAADVAEGVAIAAVGDPVNGITEIGGPEAFLLPDLIRTALTARGDAREVVADPAHGTGASNSKNARSFPVTARLFTTSGSRIGFSKRPPRRNRTGSKTTQFATEEPSATAESVVRGPVSRRAVRPVTVRSSRERRAGAPGFRRPWGMRQAERGWSHLPPD